MKKKIAFLVFASFLTFFYPNPTPSEAAEAPVPVYAFWNKTFSYRYFTASTSEKNSLILSSGKWENEGIFWYAYSTKQEGTVPIYKLKNDRNLYYYFTASKTQKDLLSATTGWTYKGVAFYAYTDNSQAGTVPIYALKNSRTNKYFYTSSPGEKNCMLTDNYWVNRGTVFRVLEENANVSTDDSICRTTYGPEISVGLWNYSRSGLRESSFKIEANKDYVIKDKYGNKIAAVSAGAITKVKYTSDKNLLVYNSISEKELNREVRFEAKDGNNSNLIFDAHRPNSSYDEYRGKIKLKYNSTDGNIWVINTLPMDQYTWGMGETTGTGPFEHTKVMTSIFRTYGYWYKKYATKYLPYGFTIRSDSGSQIYRGYEWEIKYPNIRKAAAQTKGIIARYDSDVALTPYSSWSDGRTRSFEERWGSDEYPWCKSVKDPYGKHPTLSTSQLVAAGNHMVGLVANGSVKLAGSSYNKKYDWILKYYYTDISLKKMY